MQKKSAGQSPALYLNLSFPFTHAIAKQHINCRHEWDKKQHPINAPTIGISAVNAISTPIITAYGILKIDIVMINMTPIITASRHCPVIKLEKF